jgi:UDP-GlcNAc:undecaprenyl-phosphate/decaprenyl-phosphate GlcNAc-1-phosphate transferase
MSAGVVLYSGRDAPYSWFLLRGSGDPVRDYVLTLLVAAAFTYMLTPLVRRLARRIGAIKEPRDRDVHVAPVPSIGGLAMYGGLVAGLLVADQIPQLRDGFANTGMVSGLLLAGGLLVAVGIIDDRWGMSPLTKAAGQVAAAGILVATGTELNWLPLPGGNTFFPTSDQATLLTVVIVVATINAVNFIDGLDGLAAGIVAIAAISFFLYYYSMTKVISVSALAAPALASAILIGICLGFLPHNFSPASIFMGDTGSMLLGLLLAYAPISSITSLDPALLAHSVNRYPEILPLLLPAALLVIPYADLLLAVVRRTRAGQSPFAPDRKHLHHRMLDIGHSQRASVLIMYLWAAVFSGTVVWLSIQRTVQPRAANHHGEPVFVFVAITAAAVAALLLMAMPKLRWWGRKAGLDEQAAKLRPPAAAPRPATESAEPQLVAAAIAARTSPLPAPVPHNGAPARLTPVVAAPAVSDPVPAAPVRAGPDVTDPDWPRSGWRESVQARPARAEPTVGTPAEQPDEPAPPDTAMWRNHAYAPTHEAPGPADGADASGNGWDGRSSGAHALADGAHAPAHGAHVAAHAAQPGNGRAATRSIIGTPPPAVPSWEPTPTTADGSHQERGDAGPAEF